MGNTVDCEEKGTLPFDSAFTSRNLFEGSKIESHVRIPQSKMWSLQHHFYTNALPRNWKFRQIQTGVSSSSYLAQSYANLILSYAHDLSKQKPVTNKDKLIIMDFGAGHGRLSYLIIQHILKQKQIFFPEDEFPFLFVLTDCSQAIIDWWKANDYLKPFIEKGYLDICYYDVESTHEFYLQHSRCTLTPRDISHPPFIILNSVLSCLRQDVVSVTPSEILPGELTITSSQFEFSVDDPSIIPRLQLKWSFEETIDSVVGWDSEITQLTESFKAEYPQATLVIPLMGIQLINKFLDVFNNQCILCVGDEGVYQRQEVQDVKVPVVKLNGDICMPINFDFLERHVKKHSGWTLTSPLHDSYRVLLCAYGMEKPRLSHLRLSYQRFFIHQSNDMINSITSDLTKNTSFSLHLLTQLLRLSSFDPDFLIQAKQSLHNANSNQVLSHVNIHDLTVDLDKCKQHLFPITVAHDCCFDIARMYMLVQEYQMAADLFLLSIRLYGEHHASWFNRGVCLYRLNQMTDAKFCFYRTLELNYEYDEARKYLNRINSNCHYTFTEFEIHIEENMEMKPVEKQKEEKKEDPVPALFVIDPINFSSDGEESDTRREEEYITMEQQSEDEMMVESIMIPSKEDD